MTFRRLYKINKALFFIAHKCNLTKEKISYYQFHAFENTVAIVHYNTENQQKDILPYKCLFKLWLSEVSIWYADIFKQVSEITDQWQIFVEMVKFQIP